MNKFKVIKNFERLCDSFRAVIHEMKGYITHVDKVENVTKVGQLNKYLESGQIKCMKDWIMLEKKWDKNKSYSSYRRVMIAYNNNPRCPWDTTIVNNAYICSTSKETVMCFTKSISLFKKILRDEKVPEDFEITKTDVYGKVTTYNVREYVAKAENVVKTFLEKIQKLKSQIEKLPYDINSSYEESITLVSQKKLEEKQKKQDKKDQRKPTTEYVKQNQPRFIAIARSIWREYDQEVDLENTKSISESDFEDTLKEITDRNAVNEDPRYKSNIIISMSRINKAFLMSEFDYRYIKLQIKMRKSNYVKRTSVDKMIEDLNNLIWLSEICNWNSRKLQKFFKYITEAIVRKDITSKIKKGYWRDPKPKLTYLEINDKPEEVTYFDELPSVDEIRSLGEESPFDIEF